MNELNELLAKLTELINKLLEVIDKVEYLAFKRSKK